MKRYYTSREFYKYAAVTTLITIGIVGVIVFYPTAKLPAYTALLSIVLGALCGITMGWIASIGEHVRENNKIDIPNFLIRVLSIAPITAVEEGDAGYVISATGAVWSASQEDLVGVGIGIVGMHVAIAGAIICPPVGAAAAGVIL